MVRFSPAKINLGLHIIEKRSDGFHNLQSVMYPIGLSDILEIRPLDSGKPAIHFSQSGIRVREKQGNNLCEKAYKLLSGHVSLPPVEVHLHKQIPVGAGLGGGSSNASTMLENLNLLTDRPLSADNLHELASMLGSDCPFFLHRDAMMMEGRGEILSPVPVNLNGMYLVVLFPALHIPTAEAYAGITPGVRETHLQQLVARPIDQWRDLVVNDFERSIFEKYPDLQTLKDGLYSGGAVYASLSGSGSSLYGIFNEKPVLQGEISRTIVWEGPAKNR